MAPDLLLFASLTTLLALQYSTAEQRVNATDPRIAILGRHEALSTGGARVAWPSTSFSLAAATTALSADLKGARGGSRWLLEVDGASHGDPISVSSGIDATVEVARDLDGSRQATYRLIKITEDAAENGDLGAATFRGFILPDGAIVPDVVPEPPTRLIEVFGDSDTAGYCAEPPGFAIDQSENSYVAWAAVLARSLNASLTTQAISGIGVKDDPIQAHVDNALTFCTSVKWEWDCATAPDAVLILLGPNDSVRNSAQQQAFVAAYSEFMRFLSDKYAPCERTSDIISVCGGSINGLEPCPFIKEAHDAYYGSIPASYVSVDADLWRTMNGPGSDYLGCFAHYNSRGHKALAEDILPAVRDVLKW